MNEITNKVDLLRKERGWSVYKLALEADLPSPTIRKWFVNDMYPSIPALMQVCSAFGITMADFFANGNMVELTDEKKMLHDQWCALTDEERDAVKAIVRSYFVKRS